MFGKKSKLKKNLKQNIDQIINIRATYLPQKVVLVNKDFYDDLVKWLAKKSKSSPKNLNTTKLLYNGKIKPNLKKGVDYEIINSNIWPDITEKFGPMHKLEVTLVRNPINGQELLIPPINGYLKFNIYLPIKRSSSDGYTVSSAPITYYASPEWPLKDVKRRICLSYSIEASSFAFARHSSRSPDEQISDNFKMEAVARSYSKDLDLREVKNGLRLTSVRKSSINTMSSSFYESRPNNHRNSKPLNTSQTGTSSGARSPPQVSQVMHRKSTFESVNSPRKTTENFNRPIENFNRPSEISMVPKPIGLRNLGNTCFFNAAVQCLARVMPLTRFILSDRLSSQLNPNNPKSSRGSIARAYRRFLESLCKSSSSSSACDPSLLRDAVTSKFSRFANYGQHDSQELLCSLLDGLHEDMNQSRSCGGRDRLFSVTSHSDSLELYLSRNSSPIVDIFHGVLFSSVACPSCGHVEEVHDPFIFLSLPIQRRYGSLKLDECLASFSQREVLDARNKWRCEKCKKLVCATKAMGVEKCPKKVLIIHLKRFAGGDGQAFASKIDTQVDYPDRLDVRKFAKDDRGTFRLIGAVFHSGSLGGGHYTATAIDPATNAWFLFNDTIVTQVGRERAHARGAYILFYQREE